MQKQQLLIKSGEKILKSICLPDDGVVTITTYKGKIKNFAVRPFDSTKKQKINYDKMMKQNKPVEGPL